MLEYNQSLLFIIFYLYTYVFASQCNQLDFSNSYGEHHSFRSAMCFLCNISMCIHSYLYCKQFTGDIQCFCNYYFFVGNSYLPFTVLLAMLSLLTLKCCIANIKYSTPSEKHTQVSAILSLYYLLVLYFTMLMHHRKVQYLFHR